jgi:hypothetical protein
VARNNERVKEEKSWRRSENMVVSLVETFFETQLHRVRARVYCPVQKRIAPAGAANTPLQLRERGLLSGARYTGTRVAGTPLA